MTNIIEKLKKLFGSDRAIQQAIDRAGALRKKHQKKEDDSVQPGREPE